MKIADTAILVTGANRGLGKALVEEALRRGAKRIYAGVRQTFVPADQRITPVMLDVTNLAQIRSAADSGVALGISRSRLMSVSIGPGNTTCTPTPRWASRARNARDSETENPSGAHHDRFH